jgi:hypothetical protein
MGKYTIVEKDKKGNRTGQKYTITYQVEGFSTQRFKIPLYCRGRIDGDIKYCFISGYDGFCVSTLEEKNEFLKEFYEFQKGGSYRKNHPIKESYVEQLKNKLSDLDSQVADLTKQIEKAEEDEKKQNYETYYDDVDLQDVENYVKGLKRAFKSNRYYLTADYYVWEGPRLCVMDKKLNKKVMIIGIQNGQFKPRNLTIDDI